MENNPFACELFYTNFNLKENKSTELNARILVGCMVGLVFSYKVYTFMKKTEPSQVHFLSIHYNL